MNLSRHNYTLTGNQKERRARKKKQKGRKENVKLVTALKTC